MTQIHKLTIVTTKNISAGSQAAQATHSAVQFVFEHPEIAKSWIKSPYLALLSVNNEIEIETLIHKLQISNIKFSVYREPDLNDQITSIAIEPSEKTRRLVSNLPLMLREFNKTLNKEKVYNEIIIKNNK